MRPMGDEKPKPSGAGSETRLSALAEEANDVREGSQARRGKQGEASWSLRMILEGIPRGFERICSDFVETKTTEHDLKVPTLIPFYVFLQDLPNSPKHIDKKH